MFNFDIIMYPRALMRGNPPSTTYNRLLWVNFPSHPLSQLTFLNFLSQDNRTRGKARRSIEHAPLPNLPAPDTSIPTPSHAYPPPRQAPRHTAPFRIAACRCRNIFLPPPPPMAPVIITTVLCAPPPSSRSVPKFRRVRGLTDEGGRR